MIFSGSRMSGSGRKRSGNRESSARSSSLGKTSCLMCHTPVYINLNGCSTAAETEERRKMVKALCDFRRFTIAIPENCSETTFPFCLECKARLERFSKEWDALQATFIEIEGSVADGEVQRSGYRSGMLPVDKELEKQKCSVLTHMILEGYRVKLIEKKTQSISSILRSTALTNGVPNFDFRRAICPATSTTAVGQSDCDLDDDATIEDSVAIPISASQVGETWRMETDCGPALSITNIRTVEQDQNSDGIGLEVVKQEPSSEKDDQEEEGTNKDTKLAGPRRRIWCGGIEIYRMPPPDSGSKLPKRFQCSRCNFSLLAKRGAHGGNVESPLQKIKAHVRAVHLRMVTANTRDETESDNYRKRPGPKKVQPTVTARIGRPRARRTFKCFVCGRRFSKEVLLESHLSRHEADNPKPSRIDDGKYSVSAEMGNVNAQVGNPKYVMELVDI